MSQNMYKPMRTFPEAERFLTFFGTAPAFRRPLFAIVGGTNLGKSMLAADILKRACMMVAN